MGWNTCIRFTLNFLVSLAVILAYVALGAIIFVSLERDMEKEKKREAQKILSDFQLRHNLTNDTVKDFLDTFTQLNKLEHGFVNSSNPVWTFEGAFYFCTTAITTIGTGNITPDTEAGRWFCILYVLMGIPLLSLFFGMTGYYLTQALRLTILKMELYFKTKMELILRQWTFAIITWVLGGISLLLYAVWMEYEMSVWNLGESIYYSLTTFSTIGFGDYTNYNGASSEFPLVISSFIVLTLMLPASSLMFSTTAELFQSMICPIYLRSGLVKKSELQRILAEDQLLYRYRKMKKEMSKYKTLEHEVEVGSTHDSSLGAEVIRQYLDSIYSESDCESCDDTRGTGGASGDQ